MSRKLWLTWETQRRNSELAAAFQCELMALDYSAQPRCIRYVRSVVMTVRTLTQKKPRLIVAQCPSIALVALLALLKPLFRYRFVIDAHNAFFDYARSHNPVLLTLTRLSAKAADYILVSNGALVDQVHLLGSSPIVLPDKIPDISRQQDRPALLSGIEGPIVSCICSFANDEPLEALLQAASQIATPVTFFVTGKRERAGALLRFESDRIRFTGYLPEHDYLALLSHSNLLVDVTTRQDCLLCGAYEALALEIPSMLSDTPALRDAFSSAALFSANNAAAFAATLSQALASGVLTGMNIRKAKSEFLTGWSKLYLDAAQALESL